MDPTNLNLHRDCQGVVRAAVAAGARQLMWHGYRCSWTPNFSRIAFV